MSRYETRRDTRALGWQVVDTQNPCRAEIAVRIEKAEAHIIAFALNAVAEGAPLIRDNGGVGFVYYNGPTEGVAPSASEQMQQEA